MVDITHGFVSAIADDPTAAAAGKALPSHWNADHDIAFVASARVLGRITAGAGAGEELSASDLLTLLSLGAPKVISTTYDIATASGTQALTGVGFTSKAVLFLATVVATGHVASVGFDDGVTGACLYDNNAVLTGSWGHAPASLILQVSNGNYASGVISAWGADGATITWTKTGLPTGSATIKAFFIR